MQVFKDNIYNTFCRYDMLLNGRYSFAISILKRYGIWSALVFAYETYPNLV